MCLVRNLNLLEIAQCSGFSLNLNHLARKVHLRAPDGPHSMIFSPRDT
jgi:hypothetical protein